MLKILELFAGYGSQALALENIGIEFTSEICEIDKYAIEAYNQIHGQTKNYGDICNIKEDELPDYDLITYSSPCQDFSVAGKMKGGQKGSGTRSSLLWECERIIRSVKPKYLLMENVKNLVGKKFKPCFVAWIQTLEELGYNNYWKVLNAKDYGVPQNRERVFVLSIRKDLNQTYMFPEPVPLKKRLKDVLEETVDEKFYLSEKLIKGFIEKNKRDAEKGNGFKFEPQEPDAPYAKTITAGYDKIRSCSTYIKQVGNIVETDSFGGNPQRGRVYDATGIYPALNTFQGGGLEPKIIEPFIAAMRGRNPDNPSDRTAGAPTEQRLEPNSQGVSNMLTTVQKDNLVVEPINLDKDGNARTICGNYSKQGIDNITGKKGYGCSGVCEFEQGIGHNPVSKKFEFDGFREDKPCPTLLATDYKAPKCYSDGVRIRKLTPRECWRLMGVKDEQYDRLHGISNTQLYKMAGNSIVVDVLMAIFKNLLISDKETKGQLSLL